MWDLQSLCHLTACVPAVGTGTTCLLVLHKCFAPGHTAGNVRVRCKGSRATACWVQMPLPFPCSCPPRLAVRGSPSLGPGSWGVPHRGGATAGGAWAWQRAIACLLNLPLPLPAVCLGESLPSLGLDVFMQKLELVYLCHPPWAVERMTAVIHSA